jgi:hypothetical protein
MTLNTIFQKELCTGSGGKDTKKYSGAFYDGISVLNVLAIEPSSCEKESAPWIIPSTYREFDARGHKQQLLQGKFCLLTADIDEGNHSFVVVKSVITSNLPEICCRIYSTSSANELNQKWRVLIPVLNELDGKDWHIWQKALSNMLAAAGIKTDDALLRHGQLVFLPNVPPSKRKADGTPLFYKNELFGNDELSIEHKNWSLAIDSELEALAQDLKNKEQLLRAVKTKPALGGGDSVIAQFNQQYSIEQLLREYGYEQSPLDPMDWRSPNQKSSSYATRNYLSHWVSLSQSDVSRGIGIKTDFGCSGDAFDLYVAYEFNGDYKLAIKELV